MLILGIKLNGSIMIGDNIEVLVLGTSHGHIRLGIRAPKEIPVHRKVVWNRIQAEKGLQCAFRSGCQQPAVCAKAEYCTGNTPDDDLATTHERAGCHTNGDPL